MSESDLQALVRSIEVLRDSQRESQLETDRLLKQSKEETDQAIRELSGVFTTQWGRLVEALVEPSCVEQFKARGVKITRSFRRAKGSDAAGRQMEIDVLLVNGNEVVAIEVKTTLKTSDVEDYEDRLERFKEAFPEYADKTVLGGIAALNFDSDSDKYAYRRGFFVLRPDQGVTRIVNDESFQPKKF